jgi:hypothetical protein
MQFICICYYDQAKFEALTKDDMEALRRVCEPHDKALHASGHLEFVAGLAPQEDFRVIRPSDNGPIVSKGPYARTPAPFGAVFLINAADIDEAVRIASLHPGAHVGKFLGGGIEVRPFAHRHES